MGSDTLPGTPGNQIAVAVSEVRSGLFSSGWETGAPALGNGVMWLMSTAFQTDQPSNLAFSFYYNFINTGPAVTGATMSCGADNYGYIVLNGVKYPSTNTAMSLGYEGIVSTGSFTVTVPTGLNTLELRTVNAGPVGNTTWQNQGIPNGGPTAAWLAITSGTTVLVKTTNKWRCTQFYYPGKFIGPVSLGDVAENAGLSRPYSLAALAGKTMYDNSKNATTLALPLSLFTTTSKTFLAPPFIIIIIASYGENRGASGNVTSMLQAIVNNQTSFSYTGGMGGGAGTLFPGYDPYPYQAKDLRITYKLGINGNTKSFYENADYNDYTSFTLSASVPDNVSR